MSLYNRLAYHSLLRFNRRVSACVVSAALFSLMNNGATLLAQTPPASSQTSSTSESVPDSADSDARRIADVERRLNEVTTTLTQTQHVLAKSLLEIQQLRSQLGALRAQTAQPSGGMEIKAAQDSPANTSQSVVGNDTSPKSDL